MESISVFDMLKIGVGPSSSHTLGPWRAAERWIEELKKAELFDLVERVEVNLYGSLSLTGIGHATDIATVMGLLGYDPVTVPIENIEPEINNIKIFSRLNLNQERNIDFDLKKDIIFNKNFLPFHPNGMKFTAFLSSAKKASSTFYSIGGGFVVKEERRIAKSKIEIFKQFPFPIVKGTDLSRYTAAENKKISEIVYENEKSLRSEAEIDAGLKAIWDVMLESMYIGCHTEGTLPGGLNVRRRAYDSHKKLIGDLQYSTPEEWIEVIRKTEVKFRSILKWVSCYALAVNEVNASLGRVSTLR